jgi:hypothetical protein
LFSRSLTARFDAAAAAAAKEIVRVILLWAWLLIVKNKDHWRHAFMILLLKVTIHNMRCNTIIKSL